MLIRFQSFNDEQLEEMLADLVRQQSSGIASISQNGETISFSTPEKIEKAIVALEDEIQRRADLLAGVSRRRSMVFYPRTSKGWI